MALHQAVIAFVALYAILQFGLLPKMKNIWSQLPLGSKLKRAGLISICEKLRNYSLIGALVYLTLGLFVLAAGDGSTGSAAAIVKTLARARVANEGLKNFKEIWTTWTFVVSFCVLAFAWYRGSGRFAAEKLGELRIREYRRLAKARDDRNEEWRDLPPTPQMDQVSSALQATLKEIGNAPSDLGRRGQRDQLEKRAEELAQFWNMLDFDRRLEIEWDTEPVDATTRVGKLKRFLASKGFLGDIKGIGKILSYASTGALALSLTGFAAGAAQQSLSDRVALLVNLKLNAALSESEAQLKEIEPPPSVSSFTTTPLAPQERATIRDLSRRLSREFRDDKQWFPTDADLRREAAKEEIRRRTAVDYEPSPPSDEVVEQAMAAQGNDSFDLDSLAQKIERDLSASAEKNPEFRKKLHVWAASHFETAEIGDLHEFFVDQLTDALFESVPKPANPLVEKAAGIFTDEIKTRVGKAVKIGENRIMVAVTRDVPAERVWQTIHDEDSLATIVSNETRQSLSDVFPSPSLQGEWAKQVARERMDSLGSGDAVQASVVKKAIGRVPLEFMFDREADVANLASTYESEFPLEPQTYARDEVFKDLGEVRAKLRGIDPSISVLKDVDEVQTRIARSTDVEALRNYSRLGGVLIGQEPAGSDTLHFKDLSWSGTATAVTLALARSTDGKQFLMGPYDPALINRALAYAADGRPAAVTILNAEFINRYQVMLHPALRDSSLGARIGRADEWIFRFLDPDPPAPPSQVRRAVDRLYAESELYAKALAIVKTGKPAMPEVRAIRMREMIQEGAGGLIGKTNSFDSNLLKLASDCANRDPREAGFSACIVRASANGLNKRLSSAAAPRTDVVSQIYEQPYQLDPELNFLKTGGRSDAAWPLEFTVQMTINDREHVTLPQFDGEQKQQSIASVIAGIEREGDSPILRDLKDFTILQRLFRVSLNGRLGDEFPIEKLAALASATRRQTQPCPTPRWISRKTLSRETDEEAVSKQLLDLPIATSFANRLPPTLSVSFRSRMAACSQALSAPDADMVASSKIETACVLKREDTLIEEACEKRGDSAGNSWEACLLDNVRYALESIVIAHRLRESIGAVDVPKHLTTSCSSSARPKPSNNPT